MPVPALSFATRYYNCNAGIMVTASHNPAKYNGYKAYGPVPLVSKVIPLLPLLPLRKVP